MYVGARQPISTKVCTQHALRRCRAIPAPETFIYIDPTSCFRTESSYTFKLTWNLSENSWTTAPHHVSTVTYEFSIHLREHLFVGRSTATSLTFVVPVKWLSLSDTLIAFVRPTHLLSPVHIGQHIRPIRIQSWRQWSEVKFYLTPHGDDN